ncbi:putative ubiquitin-conjugating enzyme E2 26 [Dichanthelium oligosanthes]|uniref:Putative ubiquitin-conjugating enzyme E2 26 n=1 Tax=Dichanthelium oligosanthes TaxID=888268 RepID=A0A1E5VB27_9POAL|nr:putative ubiquitin-conjugating enzyme E2 26 [Dichanthelium oligosanthes]
MAEGSSKSYPSGSGVDWKSALDDPDVVEASAEAAAGWSSSGRQKRKLTQVVPSDIIELDADDDPDGVTIIGEKIKNHKNKQAVVHMDFPEHAKSGMTAYFAGSSAIPATKVGPWNGLGGYHNNVAGPSAIPAAKFYSWDNLMFAPNYNGQFVVALGEKHNNKYYSNNNSLMESSGANNYMGIPPGVEAVWPQGTSAELPHQPSQTKIVNSEVDERYKTFKQFDTVNDHGDHFYALPGKSKVQAVKKPSKAWVKRIQHEWKVLENDLPDTIYVRVYEDRMDLLRAVIVGPAGTPYHDGLFFFDVYFPSRYPSKRPHFEDFIVGHFRNYGRKILRGCKSYMAGAQVGCLVGDGVQDVDEGDKSCSAKFKASLKVSFADLLKQFVSIGVDCGGFQDTGAAKAAADPPLDLRL